MPAVMNKRVSTGSAALAAAGMVLAVGCGGSKTGEGTATPPGTTHNTATGEPIVTGDGGLIGDAGVPDAALPPAPVTFVLTNTAEEDLVLNMDRGYQPIIFAFSGKPPNAKSILMFPTFCTASCDSAPEEICPVCEQPERVQDIKAAEQRVNIAPGESHEVRWDGEIYVYEKASGVNEKGRKKRCKCWTKEPAPEEVYTVKACGLRLTETAKRNSTYQCVEGEMTLPVTEPIRVELEFPTPPDPKKQRRRRR